MPNCENCTFEHPGTYGSGRFCSSKCARAFSTKADRQAISQRVSETLGGRCVRPGNPKFWGQQLSAESRIKQIKSLKVHYQNQFEAWIQRWFSL